MRKAIILSAMLSIPFGVYGYIREEDPMWAFLWYCGGLFIVFAAIGRASINELCKASSHREDAMGKGSFVYIVGPISMSGPLLLVVGLHWEGGYALALLGALLTNVALAVLFRIVQTQQTQIDQMSQTLGIEKSKAEKKARVQADAANFGSAD